MEPEGQPHARQTKETFYSFEEFRMMYDSTELISDRKVSFNRNNASLCLAVIAGQGVAAAWCYEKSGLELIGPIIVGAISILAIFFCLYWNGQLWSFKDLNAAKFTVLEEMAGRVVFPDYRERSVRSMNPFFREYEILIEQNKLVKNRRGLLLLRSIRAETTVPKSFIAFFSGTFLLCILWVMVNLHVVSWPR
jgi:hypothetical protein